MVDLYRGAYQQGILDDGVDMDAMGDFARGVKYAPFDLLGAPVDLANMMLLGAGGEKPFLGSEYLIDKYADLGESVGIDYDRPTQSGDEIAGRVIGGLLYAPTAVSQGLSSLSTNVSPLIRAFRDSRKLRDEAVEAASKGDNVKAQEANAVAGALEVEAAPLTSVLQRINADGKKPKFTIRDDGTYLTVKTDLAESGDADKAVAGVRKGKADASGKTEVDSPLTKEEVNLIVQSPELNAALKFGNDISIRVTGKPIDAELLAGETGFGRRQSSVAKQAAIGRAFELAVDGSPEYKSGVYNAFGERFPSLIEATGAKNYDDLVEKSYLQMQAETEAQFNRLPVNTFYHGGDFDYVTSTGGTNSIGMLRDIQQNQNLNVFRGGDPHEFLSRVDPETGLSSNEKFRAVHDYAGHGIMGNKFDALGEERAFGVHSQMYSPLARAAMASETRGQNSFVNYSPLNVDLEMRIADEMDALKAARSPEEKAEISARIQDLQGQRLYGDQRAVLLPPEMIDLSYQGGMPDYLKNVNVPPAGTTVDDVPVYHYSQTGGILELDPSYVGSRMGKDYARDEAQSILSYDRPDRSYTFAETNPQEIVDPAMRDAPFVYEGNVSGLYDVMQDPSDLVSMARLRNRGVTDRNLFYKDFETAIKDYGYSGYLQPFAGQRAALLFDETPVTPIKGILE